MMKILIVTQYYPPENVYIPPTLAATLRDRGHDVKVLTGFPNYPDGQLFDGYKQRWRQHEAIEGIDVLRVPLLADHSGHPIKRALNYSSFALTSATARAFANEVDVIYVYATQLTAALGPWLWGLITKKPYALHIQDLWPDSITGSSLINSAVASHTITSVTAPWITSLYHRAAAVIGIAPTMVDTLITRGVNQQKAHLVYNWADEATEHDLVHSPRPEGSTRLLYAGNIGDMQDLDNVVLAAHRAADAGIELTLIGDGVAFPRIHAMVRSLKASNIRLLGRVSQQQIGSFYANTDFALVTLKDLPTFRGTIPSKFQASLRFGVPIITNVQGDLRNEVESCLIGVTAESESPESLELAMRQAAATGDRALDKMRERGKKTYFERFSRQTGTCAVERILASIQAS